MVEHMFEQVLRQLSIQVIECELPNSWWGAYDITTNTIGLRPELGPTQRRSTLSHEAAHAALKHDGHSLTQERDAEELSAAWLIMHCDFQHASRIYNTPIALAHELNVLPRDVHAYVRMIQRTQK
ncbi:ImmA/IrrE family metallo-endopeptidase [Paeniglutamicibacter gangotriensis]|uniref:ImmA/IrrE family metallo-endopeptidase n=2 Tax=Paeniglutamicibacter gangotriensis TaxID=254787 RepID=A0A5B0ERQ5_9MICC|nr:ImmA/IrrE family metallo-endopeptidase [Paeniglutamicibacter gangotriensis]